MTTSAKTSAPTTLAELREAVLDGRGTLRLTGAGTAHDWAGDPEPADTEVDMRGVAGVVVHNPGDMTVEVRAGTPLRELQAVLAEHGQRVAFDSARVDAGATVGGLFATADAGPLALAYGSLRDLVIGATVVLADGTAARSGGHVIKNVAGYDLTKLLHGAHGTIAATASLVLRLHPLPATTTTVALPCRRDELGERARPLVESQVEVTALEWHEDPEVGGRLLARLEGTERGATARAERLLADHAAAGDAEQLSPEAADAAWRAHRAAVGGDGRGAVLRLGVAPMRLTPVLDEIERAAGGLAAVTATPGTGVATVTVAPTVEAVTAAHACVAAAGGTSTLRGRPAGAALPAFGPPPSSVALLRAVVASLDPDHRFGRGRLAPWLPATREGASA